MTNPPSPYAVICIQHGHGQQFLTHDQYMTQVMHPNSRWTCPVCNDTAEWDDDNYDKYEYPC
jgi:hypothetical protein